MEARETFLSLLYRILVEPERLQTHFSPDRFFLNTLLV